MAPTQEKSKKVSADEGAALVLEYLKKQNRPYSATDVSSNLHNKVTKASATKYLKELHDRKQIEGRVAGKQIVYHAIQATPAPEEDQSPAATLTELAILDERLCNLRAAVTELRAAEKESKTQLSSRSRLYSLDELQSSVATLSAQKSDLCKSIEKLKETTQNSGQLPVSVEGRKKVEAEYKRWEKEAMTRRKALRNLWREIKALPRLPEFEDMKDKELWEDGIGCEGPMP